MSEDRDRQVVPRWRGFDSTLRHGELAPLRNPVAHAPDEGSLDALLQDWEDRPGPLVAADLVSSAVILNKEALAIEAAHYLSKHCKTPAGARRLANLCLRAAGQPISTRHIDETHEEFIVALQYSSTTPRRRFHLEIHDIRSRLADHPRSPVLWSNLARLYTSVGSRDKANRAMKVALTLAPENRLILRSASRMLLHQGAGREAHRLLSEARCLRTDPWILSAEIATAAAINRNSKHIKEARKILESGRFSPLHTSELASALGTLEIVAGNRRGGRKLIEASLKQPSENAIAQAAWVMRRLGVMLSLEHGESASAEANAWYTFCNGNWQASFEEAKKWQADQPFSSRPAIHGSHVASGILQDFEQAREMAEFGLLANPNDPALVNNLGRVDG